MEYELVKQIREHHALRDSFISLAVKTFHLSFENWYKNGFWTDRYIPYVLTDHNKVLANASVNVMDTVWLGVPRRYIQIGTVMTDPDYRNQGLSRQLLEEIIADWKDRCDAVYLFANGSVLDFYPKFGFVKEKEYQYTMAIKAAAGDFEKLDMEKEGSRELLKRCYQESNPFSQLPMNDNYGLLMFYCAEFMKHCVYYSQKRDAICIAEQKETALVCHDIFCGQGSSMEALLSEAAAPKTNTAVLGFSPKETINCVVTSLEEGNQLFVLAGKENIFAENKVMFPFLSHA